MSNLKKEQKEETILIIKNYIRNKRTVEFLAKGYLNLYELRDNVSLDAYPSIAKVEATLSAMDPTTSFLIEHEYIQNSTHYWWTEYYSRSTYYRIKNKALKEFYEVYKSSLT